MYAGQCHMQLKYFVKYIIYCQLNVMIMLGQIRVQRMNLPTENIVYFSQMDFYSISKSICNSKHMYIKFDSNRNQIQKGSYVCTSV